MTVVWLLLSTGRQFDVLQPQRRLPRLRPLLLQLHEVLPSVTGHRADVVCGSAPIHPRDELKNSCS